MYYLLSSSHKIILFSLKAFIIYLNTRALAIVCVKLSYLEYVKA